MQEALAAAIALASSQGYSIEMPRYSQSFVLPFRNRKRFKQSPMSSRSFYPDIEDLKIGDVVRFRFNTDTPLAQHASQRFRGVVVEVASTDADGVRSIRVASCGSTAAVFQNEVLEVIKNPRSAKA